MSDERLREKVLEYLYGGRSAAEAAAFARELQHNAELARLLAAEQRFQQRFPVGQSREIPAALLQESRLLLRAALRREVQNSRFVRLAEHLRGFIPRFAWAVGAAALLLSGIILGRMLPGAAPQTGRVLAGQVVDLRVRAFDPLSGQVRLQVSALSDEEFEGKLEDPRIQSVLAAALQADLAPGVRLQAAELLSFQAPRCGAPTVPAPRPAGR